MRPQQNRRMRGRGGGNQNQNRKGPNPLTRNYESNGPDVKIRGSAQQIAEKYATLARDAQSAGDRVMAENYLQHAEHYNRIIMAALAQMPQQQQVRDARDDDDLDDEGDEGFQPVQAEQPAPRQTEQQPSRRERANGSGPQPVIEGVPAEVVLKQDEGGQPAPAEAAQPAAAADAAAPAPEGEAQEAAPRRARRPRRPRAKAGEEAAGEAAPGGEPGVGAAQEGGGRNARKGKRGALAPAVFVSDILSRQDFVAAGRGHLEAVGKHPHTRASWPCRKRGFDQAG